MYSSKAPYEFNAGGSGADLLRIKMLSERHGFDIDFKSTRCRFLPSDMDTCPGSYISIGHCTKCLMKPNTRGKRHGLWRIKAVLPWEYRKRKQPRSQTNLHRVWCDW